MQQSEYLSVFFVCKKPEQGEGDEEYQNGNNDFGDVNGGAATAAN